MTEPNKFKAIRELLQLSRKTLAREAGCCHKTIEKLENGHQLADRTMEKIVPVLERHAERRRVAIEKLGALI